MKKFLISLMAVSMLLVVGCNGDADADASTEADASADTEMTTEELSAKIDADIDALVDAAIESGDPQQCENLGDTTLVAACLAEQGN